MKALWKNRNLIADIVFNVICSLVLYKGYKDSGYIGLVSGICVISIIMYFDKKLKEK